MRITITLDDDARASVAHALTAGESGDFAPAGETVDRLFPELRTGVLPRADHEFGTDEQMFFVLRGIFATDITAP